MWVFPALKALLLRALDVVLPRKERSIRIDAITLECLRVSPVTHEIEGIRITTLMEYRTRAVEDVIRALKYDRSEKAVSLCAEALADYLSEEVALSRAFSARPIFIVSVPLHTARERERGFNQIQLVLDALPEELRTLVAPHALTRTRDTKQQTRLSRRERLTNVEGAFLADESVRGARIFLIDDVTTTGATLLEATRALSDAGSEVSAIALARA
mgnify:CR=1 FL=1